MIGESGYAQEVAKLDCAAGATTSVIAAPAAHMQIVIVELVGSVDSAAATCVINNMQGLGSAVAGGAMAISDEGKVLITKPTPILKGTALTVTMIGGLLRGHVLYELRVA